jgi:hypothetical protein
MNILLKKNLRSRQSSDMEISVSHVSEPITLYFSWYYQGWRQCNYAKENSSGTGWPFLHCFSKKLLEKMSVKHQEMQIRKLRVRLRHKQTKVFINNILFN